MRWMRWIGVIASFGLILSSFYPWVFIESKNYIVTGINAEDIRLGKPAYFHFVLTFLFLTFLFISKIWAKRMNLFVTAVNMGWAIRNYLIITACQGGECPVKLTAIHFIIPVSVLMLFAALFPDMKLKNKNQNSQPLQ